MRLYAFDGVGDELELCPLAARRALDHAGRRVSLAGWKSLSLEARRAISETGSSRVVDVDLVRESVRFADPPAEPIEAIGDPAAEAPSQEITQVFGPDRPVPAALWVSLAPLDRYALAKVAKRPRPERVAAAHAEIVGAGLVSTHLSAAGQARMVDVAEKKPTERRAVAESAVRMSAEAFDRLAHTSAAKGDVLATARLAGIMAAKRTPEWIPLCHHIALTRVSVDLELVADAHEVRIRSEVVAVDRTGVEMEALVAASAAALTVYDMLKAYDRSMQIGPTRLLEKSGGRSGDYRR